MDNLFDSIEEKSSSYSVNKDFTSLEAWKKFQIVKIFFYKEILIKLPKEELYDLGSQIRRASISITANIAEGYGRFHYQEGIQFYRISRASLYELKDHLISAFELGYISQDLKEKGLKIIEESKRLVNGFINFQIKQKKGIKK